MRCLVTGGAGFIGSHIATALADRGDAVRVLDNLSTGTRENIAHIADKVEFIAADVLDSKALATAMADVEVVFHQAALASVPVRPRRAACHLGRPSQDKHMLGRLKRGQSGGLKPSPHRCS